MNIQAHPFMCTSLFLMHDPAEEIAVTASKADAGYSAMMDFLWKKSHPDRIFAYFPPGPLADSRLDEERASEIPLLQGRIDDTSPARGFICKNLACEAPVTDAQQFALKLE